MPEILPPALARLRDAARPTIRPDYLRRWEQEMVVYSGPPGPEALAFAVARTYPDLAPYASSSDPRGGACRVVFELPGHHPIQTRWVEDAAGGWAQDDLRGCLDFPADGLPGQRARWLVAADCPHSGRQHRVPCVGLGAALVYAERRPTAREMGDAMEPEARGLAEVMAERSHAVGGGCCNRFAEQKPCDCLKPGEAPRA